MYYTLCIFFLNGEVKLDSNKIPRQCTDMGANLPRLLIKHMIHKLWKQNQSIFSSRWRFYWIGETWIHSCDMKSSDMFKGLYILVKKEIVKSLSLLKKLVDICKDYVIEKKYSSYIHKHVLWRANEKLEFIHLDVCGSINLGFNRGGMYFITLKKWF